MLIQIFSYDRYRIKTDNDISINTDMVLADTDMIETNTYITVLVSANRYIVLFLSNKMEQALLLILVLTLIMFQRSDELMLKLLFSVS